MSGSTIAATVTGTPKISAQAENVLLHDTMSERRSYLELIKAEKSAAASGSNGM